MKFSIVIPAYNVAQDLPALLGGLLSQQETDFEVIVVNDCSIDDTAAVAASFAERFASIGVDYRVISQGRNQGLSMARNAGMEAAAGEYILFLDGDDTVEPELLSTLSGGLRGAAADIDFIVYGYTEDYYAEDKLSHRVHKLLEAGFYSDSDVSPDGATPSGQSGPLGQVESKPLLHAYPAIVDLESATAFGYAWNKAYRLGFLREHDLRFETIPHIEDILFNLQVARLMHSMLVLPGELYHYHNRGQSRLTSRYLPDYLQLQKRRIEEFMALQESALASAEKLGPDDADIDLPAWTHSLYTTMAAAHFRSLQSHIVRELDHGATKADLVQQLEDEAAGELYGKLKDHLSDTGRLAGFLYRPLMTQHFPSAIRRARAISFVKTTLPGVFSLLKQNR